MLGSPVEVRYDDGDAVVLIQTDGVGPARNGDGGGGGGGGGGDGANETSQSAAQNSQGSVAAGTTESSRIIIRDAHGIEGCGSITIVTPNNLKISINTKRYDRQNGLQAARRTLTNDLRNKLGELDELLKASCDDEERLVEHGDPASTVTVQTQPNATTSNGTEEMPGTATNGTGTVADERSSQTVQEPPLCLLDDVLVRITSDNEMFYLGTVVDVDPNRLDCVVRFDDTTQRRVPRTSITRCDGSDRQLSSIARASSRDGDETARTTTPPPLLRFPPEFFPMVCAKQLPYDLHALKWDAYHRVNRTGSYCYCGTDGDWMREMIQCRRCDQWFHGRCVRSLQFPLFHGDTFYVFICSICNHGHEFVRRLVLTPLNLVHLVLFNLIMRNGRRFYGLRNAILPYIEDNQRTLQLPEKFVKLTTNERTDLLQNALKSNKDRFYNGKDFTLSPQVWTLCQQAPPPIEPITIPIPPEETVTESILQQKLENTDNFRFLPRVYHDKNYFMDGASRERMLGLPYANPPESISDPRTEFCCIGAHSPTSSCTTTHHTQNQSTITEPPPPVGAASSSSSQQSPPAVASNGSNNGTVGASRRKRCGIRPTPVTLPMTTAGGLDAFIPPPSNFDGPNNPFYEEESSSASSGNGRTRYIYRNMGTIKRRACDMNQRYMSNAKRRKMGHSGSSSVRGAVARKRALSDVVEESPNALSWDNVQRHNSEHNMNGGTAYVQRRSSATCSSSSCIAEQVDARVAAGERCVISDGSCVEVKPLASGRRSSGRLIALGNKNYSDTRRYKRRRAKDTVHQPDQRRHGSGRRSAVSDDTDTDRSNGDRLSYSGFSTSGQSSSCELRKAYCGPESVKQSSQSSHQSSFVKCVVVGKRTLPNGKLELLLEEQD